jgi:pSer/pThr/pTyr-binding forkhead associated (FHA) protein
MDDIFSAICREALESRQRDVSSFADAGLRTISERFQRRILKLDDGYYMLGLGPYNAGLVKLDFDELLLGREVPEFIGVGMPVGGFRVSAPEAFLNVEVSRVHAKIRRNGTRQEPSYAIVDMRSTCGTYVNGDEIPKPDIEGATEDDCAHPLRSGDFFSLGPSAVNLFLFFQKG